ncbi:MAG: DNA polymerase III subunit delta [Verrucomicrobiota bacterium]
MPPSATAKPLLLVCGDDEFAVKQRAKQLYQEWCAALGGMDHEIIDASVGNSGDALRVLAKLREALQTLPFFSGAKVIWLQNCNFLGEERTASAQAVTETLGDISQELKAFDWANVRLLISAGKVDKRKVFYKTIDKLDAVESFAGWSMDDKNWAEQAEMFARRTLRDLKKEISDEALAQLVANIGPNVRLLSNEIEKLSLFAGERAKIHSDDVSAIVTRNKQARAFALGDALGERNLPQLLRCLDEEMWEMQFDKQKSEIGLLYGLITKVRVLIFLKEMINAGWVKPGGEYARFKAQLEKVPADSLPEDKRFNPLSMNPYVLYKASGQAQNYTSPELVRAMDLLLQCNRQLVLSNLDESLVLQQAMVRIVGQGAPVKRASALALH